MAGLYAWRLNTNAGLGTLVSSKVNQWTLLVGTLPIVFAIAAGGLHGLPIDDHQRQELFLTAAQSFFALAVLATLSISTREALLLFVAVLGAVRDRGGGPGLGPRRRARRRRRRVPRARRLDLRRASAGCSPRSSATASEPRTETLKRRAADRVARARTATIAAWTRARSSPRSKRDGTLVHLRELPARAPEPGPFPDDVPDLLVDRLALIGVTGLYEHQRAALDLVRGGGERHRGHRHGVGQDPRLQPRVRGRGDRGPEARPRSTCSRRRRSRATSSVRCAS